MQSEKAALEHPYGMDAIGSPGHHSEGASKEHIDRVRTMSMAISPELFEKLYLTPENRVHGDLRKTFGNPTPIAILGFVVSLTPLSMDFMGWRGAGNVGAAQVASYYFIGGMLSLIGGLFEFVLGNTFPFVVFTSFAGFWFTLGGTLTPSFNAMGAYSASGSDALEGGATMGFNASFGFYLLAWALVTFIFLVCSLRTNLVYVILFAFLDAVLALLVGVYLLAADGQADMAHRLLVTAGACGLLSSIAGWYILFAQLLEALDFPLQLPVGDLSRFIPSASARRSREKSGTSVDEPV